MNLDLLRENHGVICQLYNALFIECCCGKPVQNGLHLSQATKCKQAQRKVKPMFPSFLQYLFNLSWVEKLNSSFILVTFLSKESLFNICFRSSLVEVNHANFSLVVQSFNFLQGNSLNNSLIIQFK